MRAEQLRLEILQLPLIPGMEEQLSSDAREEEGAWRLIRAGQFPNEPAVAQHGGVRLQIKMPKRLPVQSKLSRSDEALRALQSARALQLEIFSHDAAIPSQAQAAVGQVPAMAAELRVHAVSEPVGQPHVVEEQAEHHDLQDEQQQRYAAPVQGQTHAAEAA